MSPFTTFRCGIWLALLAPLVLPGCSFYPTQPEPEAVSERVDDAGSEVAAYIVQSVSTEEAAQAVREAGGQVTHELSVIRAVGAELDNVQLAQLREDHAGLRIYADRPVSIHANTMLQDATDGFVWSDSDTWTDGLTEAASIDHWEVQE